MYRLLFPIALICACNQEAVPPGPTTPGITTGTTTGGTTGTTTGSTGTTPTDPSVPRAEQDTAVVDEGGETQVDVAANDYPAYGVLDPTTVTVVTQPQHGMVLGPCQHSTARGDT